MLKAPTQKPSYVGPHEGKELELMISGAKPLSMFVEPIPTDYDFFDEQEFDRLVRSNRLIKEVRVEIVSTGIGDPQRIRRVLYAQVSEAWRIPSMLFVQDIYSSLGAGIKPDLERVIGRLLGYATSDIDSYLDAQKR